MAKKDSGKSSAAAGETVELANKDAGFSDPQTGFKIVRNQTAKLGDTIGRKTNRALLSGALLVVSSKTSPKAQVPGPKSEEAEGSPKAK